MKIKRQKKQIRNNKTKKPNIESMRKQKLTRKTTIIFLFFHFGSKALMLYVNHKSYFFVGKIVAN